MIPDNAQFCDKCGQKVAQQTANNTQQTANNVQKPNAAPQVRICANCGARIDRGVKFCEKCGHPVDESRQPEARYIYCDRCGARMSADEKFCANCGNAIASSGNIHRPPVIPPETPPEAPSKSPLKIVIAVTLAVVLLACAALVGYNFLLKDDDNGGDVDVTSTVSPEDSSASPTESSESGTDEPEITPDVQGQVDVYETTAPTMMPAMVTPSVPVQTVVTPAPMPATPVFTTVTASSTRGTDTEGGEYSAYAVIDKQPLTKWSPKKSQSGIGSWIKISASTTQTVRGVYIENGYPKDAETWRKNNRVKEISIEFSDGTVLKRTLMDQKEAQQVDFGTAINTTYIKITINSIYSGTKWNDTAIAEITAY